LIHFSFNLLDREAVHQLDGLGGKLGVFFWGLSLADVNL
jgi:hypothetical protein